MSTLGNNQAIHALQASNPYLYATNESLVTLVSKSLEALNFSIALSFTLVTTFDFSALAQVSINFSFLR